jgi:hypothetical protein
LISSEQKWEFAVALLVVALSIGAWIFSSEFPTQANPVVGPALFPRVLGAIIILTSGFMVVQSWLLARKTVPEAISLETEPLLDSKAKVFRALRLFGLVLILGLAPLILSQIGLLFTAVFYTVLVSLLLGAKWFEALIGGATMLFFVFVVFIQILKVAT